MKKKFFKSLFPLDTGIPDKHDFEFIKEVDTTNGDLYLGGGGGGNVIHKILKCYTVDLFTLSIYTY